MNKIYLMMNKPLGIVCSKVSDSHQTVFDLLTPELKAQAFDAKRGERLHTAGRLDSLTTGLLLITNDGMFSDFLTRPENSIEKTYSVTLKNKVSLQEQQLYVQKCSKGVVLPAEKKAPQQQAKPSVLEWISQNQCRITVTEGKFHEVRRTFLALGNEVTELCRIKIKSLFLDQKLKPGQWRELTAEEKASLY